MAGYVIDVLEGFTFFYSYFEQLVDKIKPSKVASIIHK